MPVKKPASLSHALPILFDRSRIEAYEKCPRLRFWQYEYVRPLSEEDTPRGIERYSPSTPAWELLTGSAVHEAIELLITEPTIQLATALEAGIGKYLRPLSVIAQQIDDVTAREYFLNDLVEQMNVVKACTIAWQHYLPTFLQEYEPIECEREELLPFKVGAASLTLMSRTDILTKRKSDGAYHIHNFKTVADPNKTWQEQWTYDQQLITEAMNVEHRLGHKIDGVVMVGLCKGRKQEYPEGSGQWRHNNPLVYCWHKTGEPPVVAPEWHSRYAWTCMEPHVTSNGRKCPGGKGHKLSGVYKAKVEDVYPGGMEAWAAHLAQNDPDILRQQVIVLPPIMRSEWEYERWKRMVVPRELTIRSNAEFIQSMSGDAQLMALDQLFPMHTGHGNCVRPRPCQMRGLCWGSDSPEDKDMYKQRTPNHASERAE